MTDQKIVFALLAAFSPSTRRVLQTGDGPSPGRDPSSPLPPGTDQGREDSCRMVSPFTVLDGRLITEPAKRKLTRI